MLTPPRPRCFNNSFNKTIHFIRHYRTPPFSRRCYQRSEIAFVVLFYANVYANYANVLVSFDQTFRQTLSMLLQRLSEYWSFTNV